MTQAQQIADLFSNDGQVWATDTGRSLDSVCIDFGGVKVYGKEGRDWDFYKYNFADGSAIRIAGGCWDIGYSGCFCWAGIGHDEGCERVEER